MNAVYVSRKTDIMKFEAVKEWLLTLTDSETTRAGYISGFKHFLRISRLNPDKIVEDFNAVKWNPIEKEKFLDNLKRKIQKYYAYLLERKLAPLSVRNRINIVKSFLNFYEIPVKIKERTRTWVSYHNRDLKREEIRRILEHSGVREKAFFLIMLESGLRPRTICKLQYKHIKEDFEAGRVPMKIDVPPQIVKDRIGFRWTFIGEDGYRALKEYLSPLMPLNDDDYIFAREKHWGKRSGAIEPNAFTNYFRRIVRKLGLVKTIEGKPSDVRLYCLRKYFRNNMRVDSAFREFWMGHSLGTDEHYLTRDVEKHRQEYAKGYEFLRIFEPSPVSIVELTQQLKEKDKELKALKEKIERLESLVNALISRPSFKIEKEALQSNEELVKKLPKKYVAEE